MMTEEEHYRKQVCNLYGKGWEKKGQVVPPKGDSCETCIIKWKCRGIVELTDWEGDQHAAHRSKKEVKTTGKG